MTRADELPDFLTVAEVATLLRISRGLAYEQCRDGRIPTVRLGRRILIPKAALLARLEADPRGPDPEPAPVYRPAFVLPVTVKRRRSFQHR